MLQRTLAILILFLVSACASGPAGVAPGDGAAHAVTNAPAPDDGWLVGRAESSGPTAALAETGALEAARRELARAVEAEISALADGLRPSVRTLRDREALRRFENARHLAAAETLRLGPPAQTETYLEPSGGFGAAAALAVNVDDPALRFHAELRRIARLAARLNQDRAWQALTARAESRMHEQDESPPLPPIGGVATP